MVCVLRRTIFFILSAITMPAVHGGDCAPVNLLTEALSPFQGMDVIDQRDLNICYAHAASQLAEFELRKSGDSTRVHPAWVALLYSQAKKKAKLEIGHTSEALELLRKGTLCPSTQVSSLLQKHALSTEKSDIEILSSIEKTAPDSTAQLQGILSSCEEIPIRRLPPARRLSYRSLPDDSAFEVKMREVLSSRTPLSISYCANLWTRPEYRGVGFDDRGLRDRLKRDCHYHESLVVGKKEIGGSCHFLVRNTWGSDWRKSNKNWTCVCENPLSGQISDGCRFDSHRDERILGCWLPARSLARNTGVITYLERESSPTQNSVASRVESHF